MQYNEIIDNMKSKDIVFLKGLNENEFNYISNEFGIIFPQDLKEFLSLALPVSNGFINWRDNSKSNIDLIHKRLEWPLEGILFDIENNSFWYEPWGIKPEKLLDACNICINEINNAPKLIPIYSHRYIAMEPNEINNPIFSVHQTDIIYYGVNLISYLEVEFGFKDYSSLDLTSIKHIRFWSDICC
jgi:hypothetical protein